MAHAAPGAQRAGDHGGHQFVGVQAALHQRFHLALAAPARRRAPPPRGCAARPRCECRRSSSRLCATAARRARGPTSTGLDQARARLERRGEAHRVAWMDDRHPERPSGRTYCSSRTRSSPARARYALAAACRAGARCARWRASRSLPVIPSCRPDSVQRQSSTTCDVRLVALRSRSRATSSVSPTCIGAWKRQRLARR